jgi:hypothetical protein
MDRVPIEKQQQRTEQTDQIDIEMNREQTIEAMKVMQAFVDGKTVECKCGSTGWSELIDPVWNFQRCEYRIKPTTKLRPWTADEVPVGGQIRCKSPRDYRFLIDSSANAEVRENWLKSCEHSLDGGKTWLPCGVMEEAKP